jgi:putative transposase
MARPLRIEFPGALYHVTSRGNARAKVFTDESDYRMFLDILGFVVKRFNWLCHAYCLMGNHYHLLVETPDANLSRGMRQLNGIYTQKFNWKRHKAGHLFQGRFKAILVDRDEYLLELARYMMLNPVRAGLVEAPDDYTWSSYRAVVGQAAKPEFLTTEGLLARFGGENKRALRRFADFVKAGMKIKKSPWVDLKGQIYLGDESFVKMALEHISEDMDILREVPKGQRYANRPELSQVFAGEGKRDKQKRNKAIYTAYTDWGYKLQEIGDFLQLHYASISRIVTAIEKKC